MEPRPDGGEAAPGPGPERGRTMRFHNIQVLRAFAAYAVLAGSLAALLDGYVATLGIRVAALGIGSDVFFTLSGFVLAESTAGRAVRPGRFLRARLARVLPAYWLLTLLAVAALAAGLHVFGRAGLSPEHAARSLLLLPSVAADGTVRAPVIPAGAALSLTMLFYLVFALSLLAPEGGRRRLVLLGAIAALVAAGAVSDEPWLRHFGSLHMTEFAAGVAVWHLARALRPGRAGGYALVLLALAWLGGAPLLGLPQEGPLRPLVFAPTAALLVLGAVSLEVAGAVAGSALLRHQGDAGYALCLLHPFVLQAVGKTAVETGLNADPAGLAATVALAAAGSLVLAQAFHRHVEVPMNRAAQGALGLRQGPERRGPLAAAAS